MLMMLVLFGTAGLGLELFLLEHTESVSQWIPMLALGSAFASGIAAEVKPTRLTVRLFQAVMLLSIIAGAVGVYLHLRSNVAFELEMDPSAHGLGLFWEVMRGAIPSLAPGAMVQLGLLGLLYAYRHPVLERHDYTRTSEPS